MNRKIKLICALSAFTVITSCSYTFYPAACEYPVAGEMTRIAFLPEPLYETSGLEENGSDFISFNDSWGEPALFFFRSDGAGYRKAMILGAKNSDWEDITGDGQWVYIADVGNNYGTRDTLVIYRVSQGKADGSADIRVTDSITFSFGEQVCRTGKGLYSHDCEAVFSYRDSLYLFAKDWVSFETRIYVIPAEPGHYVALARASYPVNALITGADIDIDRREVVLVGYKNLVPVLIKYRFGEDPAVIDCGGRARRYPRFAGTQMEGVCYDAAGNIYLSSEKRLYRQALYRVY